MHAHGGIRIRKTSKRAAPDPRLKTARPPAAASANSSCYALLHHKNMCCMWHLTNPDRMYGTLAASPLTLTHPALTLQGNPGHPATRIARQTNMLLSRKVQGDTKKRELLKCVVAAMYSWQHCGTGTLSYRQPRDLVIMDQWNGQQRAFAIKMF